MEFPAISPEIFSVNFLDLIWLSGGMPFPILLAFFAL